MSFKKLGLLTLAFLFLFGTSVMAAQTTWQVAAGDPKNSEQGVVADAFKEYIEKESKGEIKVECFYDGQLGDESEVLKNVQKWKKGPMAFAVAGIANLTPFNKKLGVLSLPYIFETLDEVVKGTTGEAAELLDSYAREKNFRVLTWTYTDFRYISNSKKPILTMADMKGLKFRVPQSPVLIAAYKAFGGQPTPISWAETFTSLQQGVVDGQCYGYIGFQAMKFNEAHQKYLTEVHYTYQLQPLVVSENFFKTLSPEVQKMVIAGGKYAQDAVLKYQKENGEKAKKELIAAGLQVDQLKDEAEWKKAAMEKVWPSIAKDLGGKAAINAYLKACGKPEWK